MKQVLVTVLAVAAAAVTPGIPRSLAAQQFSISASDGVVLSLPGGRLAVLVADSGRVVVANVMDGEPAAGAVDLTAGDRITSFLGRANPTIEAIRAAIEALATGAEVAIGITRGSAAERMVTFPKAAPRPVMAVRGAAGGAGAWATAGDAGGAEEVVIAGVHLRNNDQGMPAVTHRTTHPAGATVALRVGDVITAVNGRSLAALAGLELFLGQIKAGDPVNLTVLRGGRTMAISFAKPDP